MPIGRGGDGHVVQLGEVAKVELGPPSAAPTYRTNGHPQVGLGIVKTSTANDLDRRRGRCAEIERINRTLPNGMARGSPTTRPCSSTSPCHEVWDLFEAIALVLVVIWLFLGSLRAALVPAVTVPVCVTAAFRAVVFGFSINLLTLLALVLSIGRDDAIVVLENIQRRADLGEPALVAIRGTARSGFAVLATTAVLVAVFLPIAFLEGK